MGGGEEEGGGSKVGVAMEGGQQQEQGVGGGNEPRTPLPLEKRPRLGEKEGVLVSDFVTPRKGENDFFFRTPYKTPERPGKGEGEGGGGGGGEEKTGRWI